MMWHRTVAARLPRVAKDLLLAHIDGPRFINVPIVAGTLEVSRTALLNRKLIRCDSLNARPTSTVITEDGRHVLAIILADYAEALIRAGYGIEVEASGVIRKDAGGLFERHVKALPLPSGRSDTSPSPAKASGPEPTSSSLQQTVSTVGD